MPSEPKPRFELGELPNWEWHPKAESCSVVKQFQCLPYSLIPFGQFNKRDGIHEISNWYSEKYNNARRGFMANTAVEGAVAGQDAWDDQYTTVFDSSQVTKAKNRRSYKANQKQRRLAQNKKIERSQANKTKISRAYGENTKAKRTKRARNWRRGRKNFAWNSWWSKPKDPSVARRDHWNELHVIAMEDLEKATWKTALSAGVTIRQAGAIKEIDPKYEKFSKAVHLRMKTELQRVDPTTSRDPILMQMKEEGLGNVFATDTILSLLMTCWRSKFSWDIVADYEDGVIVFNKRRHSAISFPTVDENSNQTNNAKYEDTPEHNRQNALRQEADTINTKFQDQSHSPKPAIDWGQRDLFANNLQPDKKLPAIGYIYRQFTMKGVDLQVVCRCEAHAYKGKPENMYHMRAMNQYCPRTSKSQDWKRELASKGRQVALNEYAKNNSKVARWGASAVLAGAKNIQLGWVARQNTSKSTAHDILKTETLPLRAYATTVGLKPKNMWAVLLLIVNKIRSMDEGRYVLMKDPNQQKIRFYRVNADEFENEDEGDEEEY